MNKENLTLVLTAIRDIIDRHGGSAPSAPASSAHTYGITWECGGTSPVCTRTGDSAAFADPVPAVGTGGGSSPFDTLMPWVGMVRSTDPNAGEVVAIPKYWYRVAKEDNILSIEIADGEKEGFSVSPAHMDRGDGKGERDVIYVGRYHCGDTACKSVTGDLPKVSQTRAQFREEIHSLGDNVWQFDFATYWTIAMLYLVEFANWDTQSMIGAGCGDGEEVAVASGYTDAMTYHTGTNLSDRSAYGNGVQYRWIEGLWDNVSDWVDGYYQKNLSASVILNPEEFSDTEGGVNIGTVPGAEGSIINWIISSVGGYSWAMLPGGLDDDLQDVIGVCDHAAFVHEGTTLFFGGDFYGQSPAYGLFSLSGTVYASDSYDSVGARLLVLP